MRLNLSQIVTIKKITQEVFGNQASVYLFGSRVDDNKRGGDIDLFVVPADFENEKIKVDALKVKLIFALGDQKIDIIVQRKFDDRIITEVAFQTGVEL